SKVKNRIIENILDWFPAILFAYVIPAGFTHLFGWDLSAVHLHFLSRNWIIPITLLAVMSALPLRQLAIVGVRPLVLFFVGSAIIATLPVILVLAFSGVDPVSSDLFVGQSYWKGLVPIVGGWIGGSTSQLILKELAQTPESLFLSVLVLDNILVNIWTILMFQFIKKGEALSTLFGISDPIPDQSTLDLKSSGRKIYPWITLLIFFGIASLIFFLNISFLGMVVSLSIIGLVLGNIFKLWNTRFSLQLGGICIVLVMAILGLRLDFSNLSLPWEFVTLVVIWLILHFVGMLICAKILKLNLVWVPIASMANLGGISTAPAVTAAYRKDLMPHAVLLAILSMVSGTGWGMLTIYLFQTL
ncbi:MAG: putative membrane protein, partial [Algoriphagus sp.]